MRSSPSTSTRAWSWIRPERSTRSRNAILPWPRRAARRPATRWRASVSSPAARPSCAARRRRSARRRGTRAGTGRCPPRAGARAWRGGGEQLPVGSSALVRPLIGGEPTCSPTSIFVILSLRAGPRGHLHRDDLVALVAEQRLADRRLVGELVLGRVGLGRADDRVLHRLAGLLVLDVDDRADLRPTSVESSSASIDRRRRAASPRAGRSAPRASPARSWRRRTPSSRRCRRTRAPP